MSNSAHRLTDTPRFRKGERKRPRKQLVASILENVDHDGTVFETPYYTRWVKIHRRRIVQRRRCARREGLPAGEDGYRWSCTCDPKFVIDDRRRVLCTHLGGLLDGNIDEVRPPPDADAYKFNGNVYVELSALGERILRPMWAQAALRGMQS